MEGEGSRVWETKAPCLSPVPGALCSHSKGTELTVPRSLRAGVPSSEEKVSEQMLAGQYSVLLSQTVKGQSWL